VANPIKTKKGDGKMRENGFIVISTYEEFLQILEFLKERNIKLKYKRVAPHKHTLRLKVYNEDGEDVTEKTFFGSPPSKGERDE
jgi:predicted N-acyltransferase